MSRIRDIANLFSGNTDAATDAEVTAAINTHNTTANGHIVTGKQRTGKSLNRWFRPSGLWDSNVDQGH